MSDWIEPGQPAPDFRLPSDCGDIVHLAALRGQIVVLYFYPRDDTPSCTRQACSFRHALQQLTTLGAVVFGVSRDDLASHAKFRNKFQLNFPLLSDADHHVAQMYGAWREKNMYGKKVMGIQRSTYLIDAQGLVAQLWKRVNVDGHDQQVIHAIEQRRQTGGVA